MAHVTATEITHNWLLHGIGEIFRSIGRALVTIPEANEKIRRVEILMAMSDEELSRIGLRRHDIARHVFGGSML